MNLADLVVLGVQGRLAWIEGQVEDELMVSVQSTRGGVSSESKVRSEGIANQDVSYRVMFGFRVVKTFCFKQRLRNF